MDTPSKTPRVHPRTRAATTAPYAAAANIVTPSRADELEALRQRGLAKLLNRHFTETTKRVAKEKAAVDAALRDLELRKAQTSEFVPSGNGELSPMDAMAVRVNHWRNECRRKERETVLLYQRYVHKYGATGHVQVPGLVTDSPYEGFLPQTPSWATAQAPATPHGAAPPPSPPTRVPAVTKQIEQALETYLENGAMEMPSLESLGKDQTFQEIFHKNEVEFKNYYRKMLEEKGVDAKSSAAWIEKLEAAQKRLDEEYQRAQHATPLRKMPEIREDEEQEDHVFSSQPYFVEDDFDDRSIVSGLTTVNSAETRRILQDCERSVATFLREEHEAIRKMMLEELKEGGSDDSNERDSHNSASHASMSELSRAAADQAEGMVNQMKSILDDFTMQHTLKQQQSPADSDDVSTAAQKSGRRIQTSNPEEEWVQYYDEKYKRYYYHEQNSNRTQWEPPRQEQDELQPQQDSTSVSEGNETTPSSSEGGVVADMVILSHDQVMPEQSLKYSFRYAQYRRQRKKARKRRVMIAATAALAMAAVTGWAFYYYHHEYVPSQLAAATAVKERQVSEMNMLEHKELKRMKAEHELRAIQLRLQEEADQRQENIKRAALEKLRRPWACNLPLAYFFPICGRLAVSNPLFDLQELVNALMQ